MSNYRTYGNTILEKIRWEYDKICITINQWLLVWIYPPRRKIASMEHKFGHPFSESYGLRELCQQPFQFKCPPSQPCTSIVVLCCWHIGCFDPNFSKNVVPNLYMFRSLSFYSIILFLNFPDKLTKSSLVLAAVRMHRIAGSLLFIVATLSSWQPFCNALGHVN